GKEKATQRPMYEAEIAVLAGWVEQRFGPEFVEDVARLDHFFRTQDIARDGGRDFVLATWEELLDRKRRTEDKREPMERLYDLVVEQRLFPDYTEEQINHRLIGYFARAAERAGA